ncbi:MAG: helix-turn-helix domain-containing protein [Candidatus Aminicenantes bacterium]|nr:helix-turn-helix domain-containing protein [Candidatus Aminicenantes bacterium]NIM79751.1 helix-turn-helix domain-containing protein [Candidatus Aminicenantes bacterium]NIN19082.1 helix-turn-helix domain-containing protein [Candidatus Aminicenantes bacterium]NIN42984.1 helix-turn-helix domain-containing protein [Candidatus Aminicenantes bacterium]NIN85727.1 helix-turn-helix domain-containing protein [Candidatus Aminicenantes bacterium]
MSKKLKKDIGARLKKIREELKLSQEKFASELCITRSTYSKNERGEYLPTVGALHALGLDRKVSLNWLICNQGDMFNRSLKCNSEVLEFLAENCEVEELLYLMKRVPLLRYSIMEHFHQFKKDNPELIRDDQ